MLIVTGANGTLGRGIVESLLTRVDPTRIGVSVRDVDAAAPLARRGVRVRRGDFTDPASLREAFAGAERVLIVSSNTRAGDTVDQHRAAIDAAVAAGARRILYTSHAGARADSPFPPARTHAATERLLDGCGVAATSLRNGFYAATVPRYLGDAAIRATIALPADGPVAWTTQGDLAEAAAAVLAGEAELDGPTPPLTASEALTFADVAAIMSELDGREVVREVLDDERFVSTLVAGGMPEAAARFSVTMFQAARDGDFAAVDPTLAQLIGRAPTRLRDVLARWRDDDALTGA